MIITMVLSVEEETVIMHCCYCTCGATSLTHTTRTELLDMDIAKTSLRSTSSTGWPLVMEKSEKFFFKVREKSRNFANWSGKF